MSRTISPCFRTLFVYIASGVLTVVFARSCAGAASDVVIPLVALAAGAVLPLSWCRFSPSRVLSIAFALLMLVSLVGVWHALLPERPYGDGGNLERFLATDYVFPRWLLGMALANSLYVGLWQFPPLAASLPPHVATPGTFAALLCALVMGIGTFAILERWRDRLSVLFTVLTPVWILFSSGYVEYYPLVIGAWLAILAWLFDAPLGERPAGMIGCVIGVLPALYVGFAGLSVMLLVVYAVVRPRQLLLVLGCAAATFAVAVAVASPSIPEALRRLYAEMNFGESHTMFPRYWRRSSGPDSLFFTVRYAFGAQHMKDVAYIVFWSAGWLVVPLGIGALTTLRADTIRAAWRDSRVWLAFGLVVWQVVYLFMMIPKAGPTRDVDLFCPTVVVLAFLSGQLLDRPGADPFRPELLAAMCGVQVITSVYLAWIGLPPRV